MRHVAMQMLRDDDLAADAVQDTFVRLWRHRWRIGFMKDKRNFCMRALRNQCIDLLRKQKTRSEIPLSDDDNEKIQEEEATGKEETFQKLEEAIKTLPPQQQQLIEMKYVKELSIHEISQQTGLSETNISTTLGRAYTNIREKINKIE